MKHPVARDICGIVLKAAIVGLCYNAFAPKGLPLIRVRPVKVAASDSALFSPSPARGSHPGESSTAGSQPADSAKGNSLAPLHDRAMKNPDSVKAVVASKKENQVFTIITLDQFKRLMARHTGIIMDARSREDYLKGHVRHSRSIPGMEADQHFEQLAPIPRDTLVVIYCNNPECHLGRQLAEFMAVMEFKRMVLYDDGWDGWTKANMPVDTTVERP